MNNENVKTESNQNFYLTQTPVKKLLVNVKYLNLTKPWKHTKQEFFEILQVIITLSLQKLCKFFAVFFKCPNPP